MTQSQPELLERLRIDPVSAAPAVYARFAPVVNRVVRRLLGTDPDEDDIVQLAELAGCSLATAKRKVRKANRHLRVLLAPNRELLRLVRGESRRNRE